MRFFLVWKRDRGLSHTHTHTQETQREETEKERETAHNFVGVGFETGLLCVVGLHPDCPETNEQTNQTEQEAWAVGEVGSKAFWVHLLWLLMAGSCWLC